MTDTYEAVKVHIAGSDVPLAGTHKPRYQGRYETFVLTANDPVQCILPEDPDRAEAYVLPIDNDIVIGTQGQVQAAANTVAGVPQPLGTYLPSKANGGAIFPFRVCDCGPVYAGATTVAAASRVSVAAYYRV